MRFIEHGAWSKVLLGMGVACASTTPPPKERPDSGLQEPKPSTKETPPPDSKSESATPQDKERRSPLEPPPVPKGRQAISGAPFESAPPWRDSWCVSHDMAWSEALERKHVPKGMNFELFPGPPNNTDCGWLYENDEFSIQLKAGVQDSRFLSSRKGQSKGRWGIPISTWWEERPELSMLLGWSKSPPYYLGIVIEELPRAERKRRALALMKDMVDHLTVEQLSQPMAEIVVLNRDKTGERARKLLEEWPYLEAAFAHVAPLAPDFPRMANGSEFRGDPEKTPEPDDQFLLLGVCPSGAGKRFGRLALYLVPPDVLEKDEDDSGWLPTKERFIVETDALTVECPRIMDHEQDPGSGTILELEDGRVFSVGYMQFPPDEEIGIRGAGILRDPDDKVLDVVLFSIKRPPPLEDVQGRYQEHAERRTTDDCGYYSNPDTASVEYNCRVKWSDYICDVKDPSVGERISFDITDDDKIEMRRSDTAYPGEACWTPE